MKSEQLFVSVYLPSYRWGMGPGLAEDHAQVGRDNECGGAACPDLTAVSEVSHPERIAHMHISLSQVAARTSCYAR